MNETSKQSAAATAGCDVECPRCNRISFAWEKNHMCEGCKWPIRPGHVEQPYGYDVLVEVRASGSLRTTTEERHYKGARARAWRYAQLVPGFLRVLATVPVDKRAWLNAYGEGKM